MCCKGDMKRKMSDMTQGKTPFNDTKVYQDKCLINEDDFVTGGLAESFIGGRNAHDIV